MKKLRMLWVLLAVLLAAVLFIGCPPGGSEEEVWDVVYFAIDADDYWVHFHIGGGFGGHDGSSHLRVKEVFVCEEIKTTYKIDNNYFVIVDFTKGTNVEAVEVANDSGGSWTYEINDAVSDHLKGSYYEISSETASDYSYGGNFGTGIAKDKGVSYMGFVIQTVSGYGDSRIVANEVAMTFEDLLSGEYE